MRNILKNTFFNKRMEIDKIIFAVNDNPDYLDYWAVNSEICIKKLGITPVLFHITDNNSGLYKDKYGFIKKVKAIPGINTGLQAQIYRMFGTKYFPDEVCLTSDIDMLLFNKEYLERGTKEAKQNDIVIFNSDAYDSNRPECIGPYSSGRYPICYIAGTGESFNKLLGTNVSFEEYCTKLHSLGLGWDTDEIYFGMQVKNNISVKIHKLKRGIMSNFYTKDRIEKVNFVKENGPWKLDLDGSVDINQFIDCHCPVPFSTYEKTINKLKEEILRFV